MVRRTLEAFLVAYLLTACAFWKPKAPEPAVPQAPIEKANDYADKQDAAVERAAGYVAVAAEENKKAKPNSEPAQTVGVLLDAAGSFLDKPKQKDIDEAKSLAKDHRKIDAVKVEAEKTAKELEAAWSNVVKDAERKRVEAEQNLKRAQMELDAAAKREQASLLGMLGAGLIAVGTLLLLFGHYVGIGKFGAVSVMLAGAGTAALPRLFDSPYFVYGALSLLGIAGTQMLIALGRKLFARKQVPVDKSVHSDT